MFIIVAGLFPKTLNQIMHMQFEGPGPEQTQPKTDRYQYPAAASAGAVIATHQQAMHAHQRPPEANDTTFYYEPPQQQPQHRLSLNFDDAHNNNNSNSYSNSTPLVFTAAQEKEQEKTQLKYEYRIAFKEGHKCCVCVNLQTTVYLMCFCGMIIGGIHIGGMNIDGMNIGSDTKTLVYLIVDSALLLSNVIGCAGCYFRSVIACRIAEGCWVCHQGFLLYATVVNLLESDRRDSNYLNIISFVLYGYVICIIHIYYGKVKNVQNGNYCVSNV